MLSFATTVMVASATWLPNPPLQPAPRQRCAGACMKAARGDEFVARELDSVPVFGILLSEEGSIYSEDGVAMVYTQLADATKVLAKLQQTFPETQLTLMPLSLGHVLQQGGLLRGGVANDILSSEGDLLAAATAASSSSSQTRINLIASPEQRKLARKIREDAAAPPMAKRTGAAAELQRVPIFHIGAVPSKKDESAPPIWPFFFRAADVDELWQQLGDGAPKPALHATDLAALIDGLRQIDNAPAKPLICAPLDGLDFCKSRDRAAVASMGELETGDIISG